MQSVTRGYGLLEAFLAKKRAAMANSLIEKKLRSGRLLDIGSGSHPFFLLNTQFFEKVGVDQLVDKKDRKKYIKEKIQLFPFDINSHKKLHFKDEYFDCVIMLAVAEHLKQQELGLLLKEVHRVLRKGGSFIYTTPAVWSDIFLRFLSIVGLVSREEIEEHKEYYLSGKMSKILETAGFSKEKMQFGYFELIFNTWGIARK